MARPSLAGAVRALAADRDALRRRITALEQGLEDITGSINRRLPAATRARPQRLYPRAPAVARPGSGNAGRPAGPARPNSGDGQPVRSPAGDRGAGRSGAAAAGQGRIWDRPRQCGQLRCLAGAVECHQGRQRPPARWPHPARSGAREWQVAGARLRLVVGLGGCRDGGKTVRCLDCIPQLPAGGVRGPAIRAVGARARANRRRYRNAVRCDRQCARRRRARTRSAAVPPLAARRILWLDAIARGSRPITPTR